MKIAVFYNLSFGGAKRVVFEHVKGLKNKGHILDLYTVNAENDIFDPSAFCKNTFNYKINLTSTYPFIERFIRDYRNFFTLKNLHKKIAAEIDSRDYDIVLVHPDRLTQAPFLLQFLKTPSAYYCQEPLRIVYEYAYRLRENVDFLRRIYEESTRFYRKQIDRQNVRAAAFTIASCYHIRERMIEAYEVYPKVVYCGVDEKVFRLNKREKRNKVLYIGSPDVSSDGYDLAKKAVEYISIDIRPKLYKISWKKANGKRFSEEELVKIYSQSIVTLCTSRFETFGLVPLESMACGVPVIGTKVGGHRETIIDGETGFLVDFDPKEIAEKIMLFLRNPKLSSRLGRNGRAWIEKKWTWERNVGDLENLLKKLTKTYEDSSILN